jgi:hypothetical protein
LPGISEKASKGVHPSSKNGSNLQFVLVALLFGAPLLLATLMYGARIWQPPQRSNHGALLEPYVNLGEILPSSPLHAIGDDHWLIVYGNEVACTEPCRSALLRLRQSRLMLANEMHRVQRVFLHGASPPDRVFLETHHAGMETLTDPELLKLLLDKRPAGLLPGGIFLIDPLGNLVMYFAPDIDPGDMVDDIRHLLDLSRIG